MEERVVVIRAVCVNLDFIADSDGQIAILVEKLVDRDLAFGLISDVDDNVILTDLDDLTFDDLAKADALISLEALEELFEALPLHSAALDLLILWDLGLSAESSDIDWTVGAVGHEVTLLIWLWPPSPQGEERAEAIWGIGRYLPLILLFLERYKVQGAPTK